MSAVIHLFDPASGFARCGLRAHIQVAASMSEATCENCFARMLRDAPQVAEPPLLLERKQLPPLPRARKLRRRLFHP